MLDESPDLVQSRFKHRFDKLEEWEQAMFITTLEIMAVLLDAGDLDQLAKNHE